MSSRPPQIRKPDPSSNSSDFEEKPLEELSASSRDSVQEIEAPSFGPPNWTNEALDHQDIVELVERSIIANLPKRLSEKQVAKAIGVKSSDIRAAFSAVRGVPMYTALHAMRLDLANRLLSEDPLLTAEVVAQHCGFGHYGVFHRNFRRRFGREPKGGPPSPQKTITFTRKKKREQKTGPRS